MSEFAGFDLDRTTARAWSTFQARLADHIAEMGEGDTLVVDAEVGEPSREGAAPYVQFAGFDGGAMVRGEVSSNAYLADRHRLSEEQCARMTDLGWGSPSAPAAGPSGSGSANFFADVPAQQADRLAVMAVRALRDVLGVAHPAFLSSDELGPDPQAPAVGPEAVDLEPDPTDATMPDSDDQLRALVDAALTPLFGAVPEKDDDGDIPVPYGSSLVFVRVEREVPIVQIFSIVVEGVTDRERALFEVNVLNRDLRFMKFVLVEDRVLAQTHLPAWPFVPEHLRSMLTGMSQRVDELDEDLAARVGGRRAFEPDPDPQPDPGPGTETETATNAGVSADVAPDRVEAVTAEATRAVSPDVALQTLLQLDADGHGPVDPRLAAGVCSHDQELIVRLLRQTEEQEGAWRACRDQALLEGDAEEATACDRELSAWAQTTGLLRRTLRIVVEDSLGRGHGHGTYDDVPATRARGPRDGRPTTHGRSSPPTSPSHRVADTGDLLAAYDVADLVELDHALSEATETPVEVFDGEDYIEVHVVDRVSHLDYPFTTAELQTLVEQLKGSRAGAQDGRDGVVGCAEDG